MNKSDLKAPEDFTRVLQAGWACTRCSYSVAKNRLDNLKGSSVKGPNHILHYHPLVHILCVHYGARMFNCDHCPTTFYQKAHAVRHMEAVHKEQEFVCEECMKVLSR